MENSFLFWASSTLLWIVVPLVQATPPPDNDKIGVLITDWSLPDGFAPDYWYVITKNNNGAKTNFPGELCTENHVGRFPFQTQVGNLPFVLRFETAPFESAYDSYGFYWDNGDGTYTSVVEENLVLSQVPDSMITPAEQTPSRGERFTWGIDPVTGENHFEGIVLVESPNGLADVQEVGWMSGYSDNNVIYNDITPRMPQAYYDLTSITKQTLLDLFGEDRIDVRFGAYVESAGLTTLEATVAREMVLEGITKLVLTRETTDNNNYANNFQTRSYIEKEICKMEKVEQIISENVAFEQVRQVGRTPEYDVAALDIYDRHFDALPAGESVAIIYATYGLPWPSKGSPTGPFATPHPWYNEVYHENAYNNYLSIKPYANARWGDSYDLHWTLPGAAGETRLESYYGYASFTGEDGTPPDQPELAFRSIRDNIDLAKENGETNIIIMLSHWYYNYYFPLMHVRRLNQVPLNTREEIENGEASIAWCEVIGSTTSVDCDTTPGAVYVQYGETMEDEIEKFSIGYAHRIRGGIERFGVLPTGVTQLATGFICKDDGGQVEVPLGQGQFSGAVLTVPADPKPNEPEGYNSTSYVTFTDAADPMVGAWDSYHAYIGTDEDGHRRRFPPPIGKHRSEQFVIGPYRTLSNAPMTILLPITRCPNGINPKLRCAKNSKPYIWNEVTLGWDPVYPVPGGNDVMIDTTAMTLTFDVQVLGIFTLIELN